MLSIERVKEVVTDKVSKLAEYQACDQYWLLIVIDFMDAAQDQHIEWPAQALLGQTPFEKVLLYKPQFRYVIEVPQ